MSPARALCLVLAAAAAPAAQSCGSSDRVRDTAPAAPTTSTAAPAKPAVAWTRQSLLRRLDRQRVAVGGRSVGLDAGTLTCVGVGAASTHVDGRPAWTRFRCVQPTFPPGAVVGPDLIFFVEPTGSGSFLVRAPRLTTY